MREPDLVVGADELTPVGLLPDHRLAEVAERLRDGQFVLLPSDTSYSIAAIPVSEVTRDTINALLERDREMVMSLAFDSADAVRNWISPNRIVDALLQRFCPGPITVVCAANPDERYIPSRFYEILKAGDRTIGVRLPDSVVERQLAAAVRSPITTVAVRVPPDGPGVTSFATALDRVRTGAGRVGDPPWCAIEGTAFQDRLSTVVLVSADSAELRLRRPGAIDFAEIEAVAREAAAQAGGWLG
jgi:L-threonylcarbamoyladenylate synthase